MPNFIFVPTEHFANWAMNFFTNRLTSTEYGQFLLKLFRISGYLAIHRSVFSAARDRYRPPARTPFMKIATADLTKTSDSSSSGGHPQTKQNLQMKIAAQKPGVPKKHSAGRWRGL